MRAAYSVNNYKTIDEGGNMIQIIDDHIVIAKPGDEFSIPCAKCNTYEAIIGWVLQLTSNSWVTKDLIEKFIETALNHHNLLRPTV